MHDRLRTRAKARRAFIDTLERFAEAGQGAILDSIGDEIKEPIQKRRFIASGLRHGWEGVRNFAEACGCGIVFVKSSLRAHE
jgi:hypothetical protein